MFLRASKRLKDGKEHCYWSIVENKRVTGGKVVQRHVLYLGEINDSQREAWRKTIEIFEDGKAHPRTVALFAHERIAPTPEENIVRIRLDRLELHRPRSGSCRTGWPASSTSNSSSMGSGRNGCRPVAKAPDGISCFKLFVPID